MKNQLLIENNGAVRDIHTNVAENYYFHPYSPKFVTISFYEEKKKKTFKIFLGEPQQKLFQVEMWRIGRIVRNGVNWENWKNCYSAIKHNYNPNI